MGMGKNKKTLDIVTFTALALVAFVTCIMKFSTIESVAFLLCVWIFHMLGWYKGAVDYDIALRKAESIQDAHEFD